MKYLISFILSCLLLVSCITDSSIESSIPSQTNITPIYGATMKSTTITHENHSYVVFMGHSYTLFVIHNPDCNCYETLDSKR